MDYYNRLKPVLNKLSKLNLIDSLQVIHDDISLFFRGNNTTIRKYNNLIQPYFADFLIANLYKYASLSGGESLRNGRIKSSICLSLIEFQNELEKKLMQPDPSTWINSYLFNQLKMQPEDCRAIFYRYYCVYNSEGVKRHFQRITNIDFELYVQSVIYIFVAFSEGKVFSYTEDNFLPSNVDSETSSAIKFVLNKISRTAKEMNVHYRKYFADCGYVDNHIFNFYDDCPHVKYPILHENGKFFCVNPNYILRPTMEGIYYLIDLPNSGIKKEVSANFENYIGSLIKHYFVDSQIRFLKEQDYTVSKNEKKTSDWILWNNTDIAFIDCKLKAITTVGRSQVGLDYTLIKKCINDNNFSRKYIREEIESLPQSLTKDIIDFGIGVGKIFCCYYDYCCDRIQSLPFNNSLKFHAYLLSLEDNLLENEDIKLQIVKIANAYYHFKTDGDTDFMAQQVSIISAKIVEQDFPYIRKTGRLDLLGTKACHHPDGDTYIPDIVKKKFVEPLLQRMKGTPK